MYYIVKKARALMTDATTRKIERIGAERLPMACHSLSEVEKLRRQAMVPGVERVYFTMDEMPDVKDYED